MRSICCLVVAAFSFAWSNVANAQVDYSLLFNSYDNIVRMNFSTGVPVLSYTGLDNGFEAIAHAEDGNDNIIFFVNANGVYDINNTLMPGSVGLLADPSSAEISISPMPGSPGKYYIFYNNQVCSNLYYSIVDMSLNGGTGNVTNLNTLLQTGSYSEGLEVVKVTAGGPVEYRLIAFDCSAGFVTFDITAAGVGPVTPLYNFTIAGFSGYDGRSELDYHMGRLGIGFANSSPSEALLGNYDPNTNTFSSPVDFIWNDLFGNGFYGCEFSPDGSKAYMTSWYVTGDTNLVQYDFVTGNAKYFVTPYAPGQIELGPNGKLYFINDYSNFITEIDFPNTTSPSFNQIATTSSLALGITDHIQSNLLVTEPVYQHTFSSNQPCEGDSSLFAIYTDLDLDSVRWYFGDPESGVFNTSTDTTPFHIYPHAGVYTVYLNLYSDTLHFIDTGVATISALPTVDLPDSVMSCPYAPRTLDAGTNGNSFAWSTGEMTQRIVALEQGLYEVTVSTNNGCQASDSTFVTVDCDAYVFFPNAFSPNGDSWNDLFMPQLYKVDRYHMSIYNRWGELMFETTDPDHGWNGLVKGKKAPSSVYVYYADIKFTNGKTITKEGNLALLR